MGLQGPPSMQIVGPDTHSIPSAPFYQRLTGRLQFICGSSFSDTFLFIFYLWSRTKRQLHTILFISQG